MKGRDIIAKIIAEDGLDKEYTFENDKKTIKKIKEPKTLGEIAKVSFEFGRLVLRVDNPIAARKFGLSDNTWRYEFDGGTMYWYKDKDETKPKTWSCSCGKGSYTCVDNSTSRTIRAVKDEMIKQIIDNDWLNEHDGDNDFNNVVIELGGFVWTGRTKLRAI